MNAELRRMAESAGLLIGYDGMAYYDGYDGISVHTLEAFARLVAEDCAKICGELADKQPSKGQPGYTPYTEGCRDWAGECEGSIRAKYGIKP